MRFSFSLPALALAASTLLPSASANFDVYRVKSIKPYAQGGNSLGWMIFAAEPSCETVVKRATANGWWESSNDVSGDKYGLRCEGDGCRTQSSPSDVDILEMNLNAVHHYTIYKEYGLSMVGLDGKVYGNCVVFPHGDFDCPLEAGSSSSFVGWRKFRCLNEGIQPSE